MKKIPVDGTISSLDHRMSFAEDDRADGLGCGIMMWKDERDLLIAQTMAYVQSVAGKTQVASRPFETRLPLPSPTQLSATERPADVLPPRLSPIHHSDLCDEIHRRVAAFRDRQQAFHRERNEYCNAMMAKVRAAREQPAKSGDDPRLKR